MTLEKWLENKWVVEHRTTREEMSGFLSLVERDLQNAGISGLSVDWQLAIAYNAALQCSVAALAACGYRPSKGGSHHYYSIESLQHTLLIDNGTIRVLDMFRKKRNIADYERAGTVTQKEVDELLSLAHDLHSRLVKWLNANRPDLI